MKNFIVFIFLCFTLSSCIEILDDVTFNPDGSGEFKYTINLSSSKLKINSILALDSLDGKKVPSKLELQEKVSDLIGVLNCQEGIREVSVEENYDNYILKVSLHFDNVESLLAAFKETMEEVGNTAVEDTSNYNWVSWDGLTLIRQIPDLSSFKFRLVKKEDQELMRSGMYTSISRFDSPVDQIKNPSAILSKNNKAVMLRSSLFDVFGNPSIMDNTISVKPADN
ncbi:MAG: hypothetical protein ACJ0F1_00705 [Crocinitomicaceae bacterium]|tara:strand:+ start:2067 stop:2741 length:675 start_codon:yes stop_codon:yes gene_type:complete